MPKAEFVAMVIRALWHPISYDMVSCDVIMRLLVKPGICLSVASE
jgi:hypothetical protein